MGKKKALKKVNLSRGTRRVGKSDMTLCRLCVLLWTKIAESAKETRSAKLRVKGCVMRPRERLARKREQLCQQWAFTAWTQARCYDCIQRELNPPPAYTFHVCKWCWNRPPVQSGAWPISHVPLSIQPPQHLAPVMSLQEDIQRHYPEAVPVYEDSCPDVV